MSMSLATYQRDVAVLRREIAAIKPPPKPKTATEMASELGIVLDGWQRDVLTTPAKQILMLCSRQAGKSFTAALLALHQVLSTSGSLVLIVSETERQSRLLLKAFRTFYYRLQDVAPLVVDNQLSLSFANGSEIYALPGSEDTIRGFSAVTLLVVDEAAVVKDDLYFTIRPMLAVSQGRIVLLSTPKGKRGFFYREYTEGEADWHRAVVTAEHCPRIDQTWLAEERRRIGDYWYRQEYGCEFVDTDDQLFPSELVDEAITPTVTPLALPTFVERMAS
jgi:hypothetical protein